ncbi:MAG: HesA/MoeB/ThiF family protein [Gammaproteobacteria bacterium]
MKDEQLLRYSRQMMLPEIDAEGQLKLADANVLIIGAGGLGSAAAIYLASAGVGRIVLADFDKVDLSNLQRQILHTEQDIGRLKVDSAREHLLALNSELQLTTVDHALEEEELNTHVAAAAVVVDGSDNFATRFDVNHACVKNRTPLVSAAVIRFEAQLTVFNPRNPASPCYRCLYPDTAGVEETCTANGVIAPLPGIMGSMQALETMKIIMDTGTTLEGKLLLFDAKNMDWQIAGLPRDPDCPVCGTGSDI